MNFLTKKLIVNLRNLSNFVYLGNFHLKIDPQNNCTWCNSHELDNWVHVFFSCPQTESMRNVYLSSIACMHEALFIKFLENITSKQAYKIFWFCRNVA